MQVKVVTIELLSNNTILLHFVLDMINYDKNLNLFIGINKISLTFFYNSDILIFNINNHIFNNLMYSYKINNNEVLNLYIRKKRFRLILS